MIPIRELGMLEEVALREAWDHEAHDFTPWLAEHLEMLSKEIGMPLEVEGREVAVNGFSVDILARNPTDGSRVVIENQLEETDHKHLGQLLTYLAGLNGQIVVWVAARFREEHLSAINWLNEHTTDPFAFFAVRVKAVRIGASPVAPVLEVVARPNWWDRHAQASAQQKLSERGQQRHNFWAHLIARHPEEAANGPPSAATSRWLPLESVDLVIARYISQKYVGLFVRGPRGAQPSEVFDQLAPYAELLGQRLGATIGAGTTWYCFEKSLKVDVSDRANWDRMADWLHEQTAIYRQALTEVMEADA